MDTVAVLAGLAPLMRAFRRYDNGMIQCDVVIPAR